MHGSEGMRRSCCEWKNQRVVDWISITCAVWPATCADITNVWCVPMHANMRVWRHSISTFRCVSYLMVEDVRTCIVQVLIMFFLCQCMRSTHADTQI